jgi:hypothetical protein
VGTRLMRARKKLRQNLLRRVSTPSRAAVRRASAPAAPVATTAAAAA